MYQNYWAKSDRNWTNTLGGNRPWMPFAGHIAAVALVVDELLNTRPLILNKLQKLSPGWSGDQVRKFVLFAAASHDLGKLTVFFQEKVLDIVQHNGVYGNLPVPCNSGIDKSWNHGNAGFVLICGKDHPVKRLVPAENNAFEAASWHHGTAMTRNSNSCDEFAGYYDGLIGDRKGNLYREIDGMAIQSFLADVRSLPEFNISGQGAVLNPTRAHFLSLVGGIVSACDWRASNENLFPLSATWNTFDFKAFWNCPTWRSKAREAVGCFQPMPNKQHDLQLNHSSLQAYVKGLKNYHFAIIEAPTGDGKTEAAFLTFIHHLEKGHADSLLFTLPMKVAATLMHGRMVDTLMKPVYGLQDVALSHSSSRDHRKSVHRQVFGDPFFYSAKRALLARAVVATIDQAMQAVMNGKRHDFVRKLGLSTAAVVIDEVHAADVYMYGIIKELIKLLGILEVPVTLLSATLTQDARQMLLKAYYDGLVVSNPSVTALHVPAPVDTQGCPAQADAVLVTSMSLAGQVQVITMPSRRSKQVVQVVPIPHTLSVVEHVQRADPSSVDVKLLVNSLLDDFLEHGGCVGWIRNTVWDVQKLHPILMKALDERCRAYRRDRVFFLHASLHANERKRIEAQVTKILSPNGDRDGGCLVIGTNILGTSCDIDFDRLVIDSTSIENLIQASGRVHRHAYAKRPYGMGSKRLEVFAPINMGVRNIYDFTHEGNQWGHQATLNWVLSKPAFNDPSDVRDIIEQIYQCMPDATDTEGTKRLERDAMVQERLTRAADNNAQDLSSRAPNTSQSSKNTPTRIGVSNVPVLFVYQDAEGFLRAIGTDKYADISALSLTHKPEKNAQILRSKLNGTAPYVYMTEMIEEASASRSKLQVVHAIKLDNPTELERMLNDMWTSEKSGLYPSQILFIEGEDPSQPRAITRKTKESAERPMFVSYKPEIGLIVEG